MLVYGDAVAMPSLRNRIAATRAGGPRQFGEARDKILVTVDKNGGVDELRSGLDDVGLVGDLKDNVNVVVAEPRDTITDTLDELRQKARDPSRVGEAIRDIEASDVSGVTSSIADSTSELLSFVRAIKPALSADFALTYADFGPENLRMSPGEMRTVTEEELPSEDRTLGDLNDLIGTREAWQEYNRGGGAIVAIFDTAFDKNLIDDSRIVGTYHSDEVDSVHNPVEGHGTMCAGAAVASEKDGVPFNGTAPGADVILVRITDGDGQIRGDIVTGGWNWLISVAEQSDKPIVTNHSYGVPLCTGRPRSQFCEGPDVKIVERANSVGNIVSFYAAGNEAGHCGRRPSGLTNAITGVNSSASVVTVGAARYDLRDIQRYSSHGRGDCAPIADPKPNVCCALPHKVYYGAEEGWKIKDMSQGIGGSTGGTSHASPSSAGIAALLQTRSMKENGRPLETQELKMILHETADRVRRTQVNIFDGFVGKSGYDARFGHGQINPVAALEEV